MAQHCLVSRLGPLSTPCIDPGRRGQTEDNLLAITAMLWAARDCTCTLTTDLLFRSRIRGPGVGIHGVWRVGDDSLELVGGDKLTLALVPGREHLGRGRAPQDPGVDETCKLNVRNVSRCAVDALEVPDCFRATPKNASAGLVRVTIQVCACSNAHRRAGGFSPREGI